MFKCWNCGLEFEELGSRECYVGEWFGVASYDYFSVCPYCNSDDYKEIDEEDNENEV